MCSYLHIAWHFSLQNILTHSSSKNIHNFIKLQMLSKLCCSYYWARCMVGQSSIQSQRVSEFQKLWHPELVCCPVAQSCLTLQPHGLQHARLPCPSLPPGVCSNSCPSSGWCHLTISSSVISFFSCLQSFPSSEFCSVSWPFASGGQSIRHSASASILPMNIQCWLPLGWLVSPPCCRVDSLNRAGLGELYWEGRPVKKSLRADKYF